MRPDIVNLRQFYSSPLGRMVKRRLRRLLHSSLPHESGLRLAGVGYTTDLLPLPEEPASRDSLIVALMPSAQGAIYWPVDGENYSVLGDEMRPPFMPSSLNMVVMLHAFEYVNAPDELLRVWWHLLVPGGLLLLLVPNRRGLWARFGGTPFASGTPCMPGEIKYLLNSAGFTVRDIRSTLFCPPSSHPLWLHLFAVLEWLGSAFLPLVGGVLLVKAEKQIYAGALVSGMALKPIRQWVGTTALTSSRNG